jgi:hypothetical protein
MDEIVIRMVGNKLVFEVPLAQVLEAVAGKGKLTFEVSSAQIIQAVRDAGLKAPAALPGGKPGPKPAGPVPS